MTFTVRVNGQTVSSEQDKKLLRFLRDDLRLTSVKDGCSEGSCGACTVIINGKAVRSCSVLLSEVRDSEVITVEGLSDREKEIFTYAFGQAGAVQCGFCTPGMVMVSKALLDENPQPSEHDIRHAMRNNICRCTGYAKIVKAIQMAAELLKKEKETTLSDDRNWLIGKSVPRVDVKDKVTGSGIYPDDIYIDGMLFAVAVRSKHPRAKVMDIDTSLALSVPGVVGIVLAEDIPGDVKV